MVKRFESKNLDCVKHLYLFKKSRRSCKKGKDQHKPSDKTIKSKLNGHVHVR